MNYKLKAIKGRVDYYMKQKSGLVGSNTPQDSAEWMLAQSKPHKSDEIDGFPIAVTIRGSEYFFAGEWIEPKKRRAKGE